MLYSNRLFRNPSLELKEVPTFYIDGQSIGNETVGRPRKARITIVYRSSASAPESSSIRVISEDIGDKTNNEAEYHALLQLLSLMSNHLAGTDGRIPQEFGKVKICSDSQLLVNQVNGEWRVKEEILKGLREDAKRLIDRLGFIVLEWVPREQNYAGLWLEGKLKGTRVGTEQFLSGVKD